MRSKPFGWVSMVGVALLAISLACGGGGGGSAAPEVPVAPTITSFSANPTSIDAGTTTALTGIFAYGSGLITPGNLAASSGTAVIVAPTTTTTYTLTVTSSAGQHVSQSTTVTVSPYPPSITSFTANPTTINAGGTVELLGYFANGDGVFTPGNLQASSSYYTWVTPTVTTTYTLTVTNSAGVAVSRSVTVNVVVPPVPVISSFIADPTSILMGGSSTLTGTIANGTGIITPGNIPVTSGVPVSVSPTGTTTYTLTVTNASGVAVTKSINVTVTGISIVAGVEGAIGNNNGMGAAARFNNPFGIARDLNGNLFVSDCFNNTIRKLTPAGEVTTIAGSPGVQGNKDGVGSEASFYYPSGIAVDSSGVVYVADTGNDSIRKITPSGLVITLASGFSSPVGIAADRFGKIYVADTSVIYVISPSGSVSVLAGMTGVQGIQDGTGSAARFHSPMGLVTDSLGNVYVADSYNSSIRKISPTGVVTTLIVSTEYCNYCMGVALDADGNIYASNDGVSKISPSGQALGWMRFTTKDIQSIVVDPITGTCFGTGNEAVWKIPATSF